MSRAIQFMQQHSTSITKPSCMLATLANFIHLSRTFGNWPGWCVVSRVMCVPAWVCGYALMCARACIRLAEFTGGLQSAFLIFFI